MISTLLASLRSRFPDGAFGRNVIVLAGSSLIGQGVVIAFSPVMTRLFTPQEFGIFGVYTSALSLLLVVGSLRYEIAIPLASTEEDALHVLALSLGIVLALVGLLSSVILLFRSGFLWLVHRPELGPYLWFLPLSLLGAGCYQCLSYWAMRRKEFKTLARTKIAQSISQVSTQAAFGLAGVGVGGLMIGDALGRMVGSGTLFAGVLRSEAFRSGIRWDRIMAMGVRFKRFPLVSSFSAVINSAVLQLPTIVIVATYGAREGGWFALGQNFVALPSILIGQAVAQVYLSEASHLWRTDPLRFSNLFFSTAKRLVLAGILPVMVGVSLGPWIFCKVFGAPWREAGIYVRIMSASYLINFVVWPLSQTLLIMERQELQVYWDLGRLILVAAVLVGLPCQGLAPRWTIGACSLVMTLSYVVFFWMCVRLVRREVVHVVYDDA